MRVTDQVQATVIVDAVSKRFGTTDVVSDLSFDVRAGEVLGFLGPNGAGKTTTMRMILDIIRPDRGEIRVFGSEPGVHHQARIGYLPEDRGLYRDVPIVETLAYFGALRGLSSGEARRRATALLTEVGLGESLTKKGAELSRGMHQKAQLVATIINEPDLLIVDEPFQGLDPVNATMLKSLLLEQRDRGAAVVMSTHDMEDAQTLCDRILLIDRGRTAALRQRRRSAAHLQRWRSGGRRERPADGHDGASQRRPRNGLRRNGALPLERERERPGPVPRAGRDTGGGRALRRRGAEPERDLRPRRRRRQ